MDLSMDVEDVDLYYLNGATKILQRVIVKKWNRPCGTHCGIISQEII